MPDSSMGSCIAACHPWVSAQQLEGCISGKMARVQLARLGVLSKCAPRGSLMWLVTISLIWFYTLG